MSLEVLTSTNDVTLHILMKLDFTACRCLTMNELYNSLMCC